MTQLLIVLLKINLVLLLFAAAYYLILRRLTFYTLNRLFLVLGILFSSAYPFINLTDFFHRQKQISQNVVAFVPELNQQVNSLVPSNFITKNLQLFGILFYIGVALMALRLIIQFVSLYKMHRKSSPGDVANYKVRILDEPVSPFSFWQTVYINPALHQEKELHTILAHEQIHVKQWHSLDIILAELSVVFYWFNPGVWLMKKAVKENLEFITDQKILNKGIDRKTYQYSLLDVGNLTPAVAIVNNFNLSDLKKRIKMMNVKRSSRLTLSRYLLVTPVLLLTTLAFTVSKKDIKRHLQPLHQALVDAQLIPTQTQSEVKTAVKRKAKNGKQNIIMPAHGDTSVRVHNISMMIKTIFREGDSLNMADLPELPRGNGTGEFKMQTSGKLFVMVDSLSSHRKDGKNIQVTFSGVEPRNEKMIIVKGHRAMLPDSAAIAGAVTSITVNGKKMSIDEFNAKIKAEEIKMISVNKPTMKVQGVQIETKQ